MNRSRLTKFTARHVRGALVHCLCFGVAQSQCSGPRRTVYHFPAGRLFAIVKWRRFQDDRQHRSLLVLEAAGETSGHDVGGVRPPPIVHAIVDQLGPAGQGGAVDRMLDCIQTLQARGQDPARLGADYWRAVSIRIMLRQPSTRARARGKTEDAT